MAYIPPVSIPSLSGKNYAGELYGMISGVGEAYYGAKRDKIGDQQWQSEQDRMTAAQGLAQSNADRNYALELKKFEADQAEGPGTGYAGTSMDAQNWNIIQAGPSHPMYAAAHNQLFEQPKYTTVQTDTGLQVIPTMPVKPEWVVPPSGGGVPRQGGGAAQTLGNLGGLDAPLASPPQNTGGGIQAPMTVPGTSKDPEAVRTMKLKATTAYHTIDAELRRYEQLVKQGGISAMPGAQRDNMNAVRQGIMLQLKELFNLGVLNGPDLSLMERMIYDPVVDPTKEGGISSLPDQFLTGALGGIGGVDSAADRAANSATELRRMLANIVQSLGQDGPARGGQQIPPGGTGTTQRGVTFKKIGQ